MQKILIVQEGQWGSVKPESYEELAESIKLHLDRAEVSSLYRHGEKEKAAETAIVATTQEAEKLMRRAEAHVVIFLSRGMEREAEELAAKYPNVRVIVVTGLIPAGKVVWLEKWWLTSGDTIREIILHARP